MSKEKTAKIKTKTTGMDILYRIVMAALAVCVPIAAYFANLIYYVVESDVFKLLAQIKGDSSDDGSTYGYFSFNMFTKDILPLLDNSENKSSLGTIWDSLSQIHTAIIFSVAFFVISLIIAVVVFFFSAVSNKKKVPFFLSIGGLVSTIAFFISFRQMSTPMTDGTITLTNFFGSSLISSLLPFLASFSVLNLSTAWFLMLFLYIGMVSWSGANYLIEDKPKKIKVK